MADVVVIVGTTRGEEQVPVSELKQMAGRCGRGPEATGEVYVLSDSASVESAWYSKAMLDVTPRMDTMQTAFHVLREIKAGRVCSIEAILSWHNRSLTAFFGEPVHVSGVWSFLRKCGMIEGSPERFGITERGKVSVDMYLHPANLHAWVENFKLLFEEGMEDNDAAVAWAFGELPLPMAVNMPEEWKDEMSAEAKSPFNATRETEDGVTAYWAALKVLPFGQSKCVEIAVRDTAKRVLSALIRLDHPHIPFYSDMSLRIEMRLRAEHMVFYKLGLTKGQASYLAEKGVDSMIKLKSGVEGFWDELDEPFREKLRKLMENVRDS